MDEIAGNLIAVRERIHAACRKSDRAIVDVELIAVSKTFPPDAVRAAVFAGQLLFGESKLQEAGPKIAVLPDCLRWHFIGRVQTNKVKKILQMFETIHAVDSLRLARCIADHSEELGIFHKVFLQVNLAEEDSKGGFEIAALDAEMEALLALKNLEILGLMAVPPAGPDAEASRPWFVKLRGLRDRLEQKFGRALPSLSMGMSGDYEVAIEEGATHIRVGSAIFGKRAYRVDGELG